jgi:hypothetical protein
MNTKELVATWLALSVEESEARLEAGTDEEMAARLSVAEETGAIGLCLGRLDHRRYASRSSSIAGDGENSQMGCSFFARRWTCQDGEPCDAQTIIALQRLDRSS